MDFSGLASLLASLLTVGKSDSSSSSSSEPTLLNERLKVGVPGLIGVLGRQLELLRLPSMKASNPSAKDAEGETVGSSVVELRRDVDVLDSCEPCLLRARSCALLIVIVLHRDGRGGR